MPIDPQDTQPRVLGEISQGPSAFDQFLDRNQKNLIILSIVIALGVAVYLVYQGIANSHERSAGADICKADDLASLQALIKQYPGTSAAGTAEIILAERQWTDSQQPAAIETLKAFISTHPKHPGLATAKTSLAAKLKFNGKTAEATALFQEVAEDPDSRYLAPYALLSLGDLAKAAGNLDQAEKSYQKAKTVLPGNSFTTTIDLRLANLKTKLPVEIDPPAAPATPPAVPIAPGTPIPAPVIPGAPPAGQDNPDTDVPPVNLVPGAGAPSPTPPVAIPAAEPPVTPPAENTGGQTQEKPQEPAPPTRSEDPAAAGSPPAGTPAKP